MIGGGLLMKLHEIFEAVDDSVIIHGYIKATTDKAYKIELYNTNKEFWIPRSQIKPLSPHPSRQEFDNKYSTVYQDPVSFKLIIGFKMPRWILEKNNIGMHMIHHWKQEHHIQSYSMEDQKYISSVAREANKILQNAMRISPARKADPSITAQRQHELESSYDRSIPKELWDQTFFQTPHDYRLMKIINDIKECVAVIEKELNGQSMGLDAIDKIIRRIRALYTEAATLDANRS